VCGRFAPAWVKSLAAVTATRMSVERSGAGLDRSARVGCKLSRGDRKCGMVPRLP